ncbi:Linear gramicidin synthase subunit D [Vibrio ruber DSM 16370]|uniref:Linear gramicidin synthase subunit D n=1 Tax=Vibrio ruber (strain DSM 16370 / JCM 11486 / BCRC 17186 / CECT 7878 / LMG 23124 / VR1) TaxID=1123498 RepID=A0A1R4LUR4_VIBR1|nr:thioester reductase domain-containing protein [Vibrio ruber]SJN60077.1 Linear gramicidin synthase subunit D [Vibrio ruber DSM 16370]
MTSQLAATHLSLSDGPLSVITMLSSDAEQTWLACCFHHIIIDAPSVRIVLQELLQLYCTISEHRPWPAFKDMGSYQEFTRWQAEVLTAPENNEMREYWRQVLQPAPPLADLPIDFPRRVHEDTHAAYATLMLNDREMNALQKHSRTLSMTPFMYLSMCWQFFLSRMSGQDDITIGVPFTLRDQSEFSETPGYMINTLPVRMRVKSSDTVRSLASEVRQSFIDAHFNKQIPFNEIVAVSRENTGQDSPLFSTMLVMPDTRTEIFDTLPFKVTLNDYFSQMTKYDLTLFFEAEPQGKLVLEYKKALYHPQTMDYWLKIFCHLLTSMGENSDRLLESLDLLDVPSKRDLIVRSSREPVEDISFNAFEAFNQYAANHSAHTALITAEGTHSYGWLAKRSVQIAAYLQQHFNIGPGKRVALSLGRDAEAIATLFGVVRTGASYIPIDPQYPQERISYMLQDACVDCVAITRTLAPTFPFSDSVPRLIIDDIPMMDPLMWSDVERNPDDELYIIYTSGSTGQPKGVRLLNKTLDNLIVWQRDVSDCGEGDCTLHFMSLSFDVSVQEIFGTLASGGRLYIASEEERRDLGHLQDVIVNQRINRLYFPYVALQQFVHLSELANRVFPNLKEVYSTGEQLVLTADIKQFFRQPIRLINLYGPSESHVCSAFILPPYSDKWGDAASIGYPLPGFSLLVVDEHVRLVPAGVAGELLIVSDFLSPGYHNKEEENARRFLQIDTFNTESRHAYRTGDLVRLEHDDKYSYLGRIDSQLKIRGFRIEPSEVEAAINAMEGVLVSAVVGREAISGGKQLVAFISGSFGDKINRKEEIQSQLRLLLPEYMVPTRLVFLDRLPTTPSGKIDRKALVEIEIVVKSEVPEVDKPLTTTQEQVRALWQALFPERHIRLHDDFFSIGGHSLLATQLVFQLRKAYNSDIPLRLLFNHPTLSSMAASVDAYLANERNAVPAEEDLYVRDGYEPIHWQESSRVALGKTLLTGATGFLGIYLLRALLHSGVPSIICLVRAGTHEHALARLRDNAARYGIAGEIDFSRVEICLGDIGQTDLGLNRVEYVRLSERVDTVFHAAAQINFVLSYSSVKQSNVQGTMNILTFCGDGIRKSLHYLSTIAVFSPHYPEQPIVEHYIPDYPAALSIGYTQSKWVAERYVIQAREQGLNANIFRIGRIGGDSRSGACQSDDFLWRQMKSYIQMGVAPEPSALFTDLLPVDFVADVVVALAQSELDKGENYHIFHPHGTTFEPVYQAIRSLGYSLEITSYYEWMKQLELRVTQGKEVALGSLIHLFNENSLDTGDNVYGNPVTTQCIEQLGVSFPELSEIPFKNMITYFRRKGELL